MFASVRARVCVCVQRKGTVIRMWECVQMFVLFERVCGVVLLCGKGQICHKEGTLLLKLLETFIGILRRIGKDQNCIMQQ